MPRQKYEPPINFTIQNIQTVQKEKNRDLSLSFSLCNSFTIQSKRIQLDNAILDWSNSETFVKSRRMVYHQ